MGGGRKGEREGERERGIDSGAPSIPYEDGVNSSTLDSTLVVVVSHATEETMKEACLAVHDIWDRFNTTMMEFKHNAEQMV